MTTASPKSARTRTAKSKFGGVAVVCTKCAKRQGLPAKAIRKLLKDAHATLRPGGRRREGQAAQALHRGERLPPLSPSGPWRSDGGEPRLRRVLLLDPDGGHGGRPRAALLPEFGPIAGLAAERDTPGAVDETAPPR